MNPASQPGENITPDLTAALNLLWARFLPEMRARVSLLEAAAAACAAGRLSIADREAAHAAAHKLAGTLGTFSLAHGTELAREFEQISAREQTADAALAERLAAIAGELRTMIDSRK